MNLRKNKTVKEGIIKTSNCECPNQFPVRYVEYCPGNGLKYRLLITNASGIDEVGDSGWVVTNLNSMQSMAVTDNRGLLHYNYVSEKLKCEISDAVVLAELLGHWMNRKYISCEELTKKEPRYYVDLDNDTGYWCVFDSEVDPHKAVSSWSSMQDADDDAARSNERG